MLVFIRLDQLAPRTTKASPWYYHLLENYVWCITATNWVVSCSSLCFSFASFMLKSVVMIFLMTCWETVSMNCIFHRHATVIDQTSNFFFRQDQAAQPSGQLRRRGLRLPPWWCASSHLLVHGRCHRVPTLSYVASVNFERPSPLEPPERITPSWSACALKPYHPRRQRNPSPSSCLPIAYTIAS